MELPNRDREEAALYALLLPVFEEWERDLLRVGFIPWESYQARVQAILSQRLAGVFLFLVLLWQEEVGFTFNLDAMASAAVTWATSRAVETATRLRVSVQRAYDALFKQGLPPEEVKAQLAGVLDGSRAAMMSATEVTAAQSAGLIRATQEYQAATGAALEGVWVTELDAAGKPDSRVCPICRPLNGTPRAVWGLRFPLGPPAHPRCRCHLNFQPSA